MRSLADSDPMSAARGFKLSASKIKISPWRALFLALGVAWALVTIWLFAYYWENSGWMNEASQNQMLGGHIPLDRQAAAAMGLGVSLMAPTNGTDPAIGELVDLRTAQKTGTPAQRAVLIERIRTDVNERNNEAYRMIWAPVLSCANAECDNNVYVQAAANLAARSPRWVGHAMIIEAVYWQQARRSGDASAQATAVARLDNLVRTYGTPSVRGSWNGMQACTGNCPLFDELMLDFIKNAAEN